MLKNVFRAQAQRRHVSAGWMEALESRCLLSITFPNFSVIESPLGNPTLPVGVQVFSPPVDSTTPGALAPAMGEWTRAAGPDQTLAITGDNLSAFSGVDFGKDTRFIAFGQSTSGNATTVDASIQRLDGSLAAVTLGAGLPSDAMYLVWAQDNNGTSYPIAINHTDAWWVGPDAGAVGETVSVYGRNLTSGATPTSYVYLTAPGSGTGVWATVTAANPYKVDFTVPTGLANGTYEVWVHNGRGGAYGWSCAKNANGTKQLLTVRSAQTWTGPTYNVVTQYGAYGDGVHDDSGAIQNAINAASTYVQANPNSRPTVYLPAGNYYLINPISPASNVRILGAGKDGSGNWLTTLRRCDGPRGVWNMDGTVSDLTLNADNGTVYGAATYVAGWKSGATGAFSFNGATRIDLGNATALNFSGSVAVQARVLISSTIANQTIVSHGPAGGTSIFLRARNGNIEFGYNNGGGDVYVSTAVASLTAWGESCAFTGIIDNGVMKLYQGTVLRASAAAAAAPAVAGSWSVGADSGGGNYLTGAVDAVRIYAHTLATDDITNFAKAWSEGVGNPIVLNGATAANSWEINGVQLTTDAYTFLGDNGAGTAIVNVNGTDVVFDNTRIYAGKWRGLGINGSSYRVTIKNSDHIANTAFSSNAKQLFFDHVNFYGTYDAEEMLASWDGSYISMSNCTARDWDPSNPNSSAGFAGGRLFVGSTPGGSQRYIYIGDNTTYDLAPRPLKGDQNAGEQVLWDQNAGNMSKKTFVSATSSTVVVAGNITNLSYGVVIAGGKGIGQTRNVASYAYDSVNNQTTVTLDQAWGIIPDATSVVLMGRIVGNVAIYHNTLDGKSDYATRVTASSGVNFFNDAFHMVADGNTITDVRTGINLNGISQGTTILPIIDTLMINNTVTNVYSAYQVLGDSSTDTPPVFGSVWRNNVATNMTNGGIVARAGDLTIFEDCSFTNTPMGVVNNLAGQTNNLILHDDTFTRGTATLAGSVGLVTTSNNYVNIDPAIVGNTTFNNFEKTYGNTTSPLYYGTKFYGGAYANNGKMYLALNATLSATAQDVIRSFDPAAPLNAPTTFLQGVAGSSNANLTNSVDILFTNTTYVGPNANPTNCDMYVLNAPAGANGTVSKYHFDATGAMTYEGDVVTGLGIAKSMTMDASGNLLIAVTDWDLSTTGNQPRLYKWDGTTLTTLIDTASFKYGANSTIRTPGGVAVDASGRIYITYSSVAGIRRFTSAGVFDADFATAGNNGAIELASDNNLYFVSTGPGVYQLNVSTGTVSSFVTTTNCPDIAGQSSILGLLTGRKLITDTDGSTAFDLYFSSAGGRFIAAKGPGGTNPGAELNFRDDVYPVGELPTRVLLVAVTAGSTTTATLPLVNAGPVGFSYTLTESASWLSITSNNSGTLNAQAAVNAGLAIDATALSAGTYSADLVYSYTTSAGTFTKKATVVLTVNAVTGTLISDYFNYGSSALQLVGATANTDGLNGGTNFTTGWRWPSYGTAADYPSYTPSVNLTSSTTGYANTGNDATTGSVVGAGTRGDRYAYRGVNALNGTVWISALVKSTSTNRYGGMGLDSNANAPTNYVVWAASNGGQNNYVKFVYNGTTYWSASSYAINTTYLMMVKVTLNYSGANDRVQVWFAPVDVTTEAAMGTPTFDSATQATPADVFGATFDYISIKAQANVWVDALRLSNSANAFSLVTGGSGGGMMMSSPGAETLSSLATTPLFTDGTTSGTSTSGGSLTGSGAKKKSYASTTTTYPKVSLTGIPSARQLVG